MRAAATLNGRASARNVLSLFDLPKGLCAECGGLARQPGSRGKIPRVCRTCRPRYVPGPNAGAGAGDGCCKTCGASTRRSGQRGPAPRYCAGCKLPRVHRKRKGIGSGECRGCGGPTRKPGAPGRVPSYCAACPRPPKPAKPRTATPPRILGCRRCGSEFAAKRNGGYRAHWCQECRPYARRKEADTCSRCSGLIGNGPGERKNICAPCRELAAEAKREQDRQRRRRITEERRARPGARIRLPGRDPNEAREASLAKKREWTRERTRRQAEAAGRPYITAEQRRAEAAQRKAEREAAQAAARAARIEQKPWLASGLTDVEKRNVRRQHDPEFDVRMRVLEGIRRGTPDRIARKMGDRLRDKVAKRRPSRALEARLGYTIEALCRHIERQFTKGMTWELFQVGAIHLDHIVPLRCFDLSREEEVRAAWAITNLAPKWPPDNQTKAGKRLTLL